MAVRPATANDYDAYARLMPELGVPDPVPTRERFASELCPRTLVAVEDGAVVGYALFEVLAEVGYVRNLVSLPARRRAGIGVALMAAMRTLFVEAGARAWCLNVKPDNLAAVALYRRFGLEPAYRSAMLRLPSSAAVLEAPADLMMSEVQPEDDAAVETATRLLRGQLASARRKRGRLLRQFRRRDAIVGAAVFDPAFPGAWPFRVVDARLGPAVLELLRALAPAGSAFVQVGIEDDDALRDVLIDRGAELHMEILHMRGQLGPPGH